MEMHTEPKQLSPGSGKLFDSEKSLLLHSDWICSHCTSAFEDIVSQLEKTTDPTDYDPIWASHHPNVPSLRASAQAGCGVCKIVMTILRDMNIPEKANSPEKAADSWPYVAIPGEARWERLRFYTDPLPLTTSNPSPRGAMRFGYYMFDKEDNRNSNNFKDAPPWLRISQLDAIVPHLIGREVSQRPSAELAASWLAECVEDHDGCRAIDHERSTLPTRVLEVQVNEADTGFHVRLVQTVDLPQPAIARYVALSHCWGTQPPDVLTTRDTLPSHLEEIPFGSLARNFQDAVRLTTELGIPYLWIDSLCIIQHDVDDWQRECSKMASIFQNATITIAAESASNAHAGFWNERERNDELSCSFSLPRKDGLALRLSAVRDEIGWKPFLGTESPPVLRKRGWVHQERLLSPRTLYCGSKQMYYECLTSQRFEEIHPAIPQRYSKVTDVLQFSIRAPWLRASDAASQHVHAAYNQYYSIVSEYSRCRLTNEDDRLAAISGIATRFQEYSKDDYLAGIWKGDVLRGLCWSCEEPYFAKGSPSIEPQHSPPSWSWASSRYSVTWRARDVTGNVLWPTNFLSARVQLVGQDKFGQVSGGEMHLSGLVRSGYVANTPVLKDLPNAPDISTSGGLQNWLYSARGPDVRKSALQLYEREGQQVGLCWFFGDVPLLSEADIRRQDVSCLLMDVKPVKKGDKSWFVWVGLALELASDKTDTYRRVGLLVRWTDTDMWLVSAADSLLWIVAGERKNVCII